MSLGSGDFLICLYNARRGVRIVSIGCCLSTNSRRSGPRYTNMDNRAAGNRRAQSCVSVATLSSMLLIDGCGECESSVLKKKMKVPRDEGERFE